MKSSEYSWRAAQVLRDYSIVLQPWQEEILEHWKSGNLLVKASRRTGKDTLCALLALEQGKAGHDIVVACPNRRMVEPIQEVLDRISRSGAHGSRITVTGRVERGIRADIGIANEAGWMTSFQLDDLQKACGRVMMISSWPPDPDSNRFSWLWRYGGLRWQRLEVPCDLEWGAQHIDHFTDEMIYTELLRSPYELGRQNRC